MNRSTKLLTKAATRAFARSSAQSLARNALCALRPAPVHTVSKALSIRAINTSAPLRGNGSIDTDLAHTLSEEIDYEAKQAAEEGVPDFIQAFTNKTGFKIKAAPGESHVVMTKQFGTETITVAFDVSEIMNVEDPIADISVYRENEQGEAVKDAEQNADDVPEDFPIFFTATFAKPGAPVLHMELECEEGEIGIEHMKFLPDEESAISLTMEKDWARKQVYCGPIFGQLSDDLKENIDEFLAERSIDTALTLFMLDYIEYKEQSEYLSWLKKFKRFIDA
ncbi:Mitochondrial acidic protein mam33 [Coemansia spiralis]|uniref:Mitochondrial acidic protein mam33 n=2 Tax=Coemansia TaxID=4863 RepID=A0A9W8GEY9_9FUNG|nr:mitochondrial glycoprotein [Coemansia spiralis]KAJ1996400.1 Mitochondrial acidic protein mam33 [Coemansia umbellata]KAJ2624136.1 Mitochondrial acidic protein mam33 [Coemansia sp. RSA 1358]KAJ2680828.1 Mitochondrial acidic protein mam33 [Coemansia spiralis]